MSLLFLAGCGEMNALGFCSPNEQGQVTHRGGTDQASPIDSRATEPVLDAGIVLADRPGYLCMPLDRVGLSPTARIEHVRASCECIQPRVVKTIDDRGDFSLLDCNLEHARARIGNDNILSCLGDESGSLYFDCDEWWDCFDSRVCAEFKSFCYVHIDDDTGVAECVVSPAGGSHVAATAPEGCIDYPWYN